MAKPAPVVSVLAGVALMWNMVCQSSFFQPLREQVQGLAGRFLRRHARRLIGFVDPYLTVTVAEHDGGDGTMRRGDAYEQATAYLGDRFASRARGLRVGAGGRFVLSLGDGDEVADEFRGATVWWSHAPAPSGRNGGNDHEDAGGGRAYRLAFHRRHRDLVVGVYLPHVCREGRAVMAACRRRKLFTNDGFLGFAGTKKKKKDDGERKVTLSGVLNFIDGLWSACGGERVVVFTTNQANRLDPALIRRGRMDKQIHMSYCCFESFRFLANNYLAVDDHPLFDDVAALLREVEITPADVAELLTRKGPGEDADSCLAGLVAALQKAKEAAVAKTKDEEEIVEDE